MIFFNLLKIKILECVLLYIVVLYLVFGNFDIILVSCLNKYGDVIFFVVSGLLKWYYFCELVKCNRDFEGKYLILIDCLFCKF